MTKLFVVSTMFGAQELELHKVTHTAEYEFAKGETNFDHFAEYETYDALFADFTDDEFSRNVALCDECNPLD